MGVEKVSPHLSHEEKRNFSSKSEEMGGVLIAQPFIKEVALGEKSVPLFDGIISGAFSKYPNRENSLPMAQGLLMKRHFDLGTPPQCQKLCSRMDKCEFFVAL